MSNSIIIKPYNFADVNTCAFEGKRRRFFQGFMFQTNNNVSCNVVRVIEY
jgi:hypothetical protein